MAINFNGQTNILYSQIGDNNTYYNESFTENDWKNIENIFNQQLMELDNNSDLYYFFSESKKYASDKNEKGLKIFFQKHSVEFLKNVFYNMSSTGIIALLAKIGISI